MNFQLKALDDAGRFVTLALSASSVDEAEQLGRERGLEVLAVESVKAGWLHAGRHAKFPLLLFNQEMLALMAAGLSIVETLETLLEKEQRSDYRTVLQQVVSCLHQGQNLSQAFESQPQAFPALYIATVRASERSGNLQESLQRYVSYQTQIDQMRKKLIAAAIYPTLLMLVGGLVVLFLLLYVVPKFGHIYADNQADLPLASWLLMQWGVFVDAHAGLLAWLALGSIALISLVLSRPEVRAALRALLWRLPFLGQRMRIYQLSRFYRTLGMLLDAGIPILAALDRVAGLLDQRLQQQLAQARNAVREGLPLSHAMEQNSLSTSVALRLLRVGERSGQIGQMMGRIADFHEEELNRWIEWASRLFEPLLMTFIGIVIGGIVVLMYLPIFELAGSLQ
ncbi:type II secretion system F family protein [Methylobacillus flagellatus]|uniref:type II secretion system F family protein n=1 Tax=Methylobacillus flagellatus TaxID=405 RepID=UPI0010F4A94E|nr:type II secretion system F family protein [Methylobacillus flagellatus]